MRKKQLSTHSIYVVVSADQGCSLKGKMMSVAEIVSFTRSHISLPYGCATDHQIWRLLERQHNVPSHISTERVGVPSSHPKFNWPANRTVDTAIQFMVGIIQFWIPIHFETINEA